MESGALRTAMAELEERRNAIEERRNALVYEVSKANTELADVKNALAGLARLLGEEVPSSLGLGIQGTSGVFGTSQISIQEAVRYILRSWHGEIHVSDLWERAKALGARSNAKSPLKVVDSAIQYLVKHGDPIARGSGTGTYKWTGGRLNAGPLVEGDDGALLYGSGVDQGARIG